MTKREKFIQCIQKEIFDNDDIYMEQYDAEDWEDIVSYWNEFNKTDKSNKENNNITAKDYYGLYNTRP